jgi:hypothetical protein
MQRIHAYLGRALMNLNYEFGSVLSYNVQPHNYSGKDVCTITDKCNPAEKYKLHIYYDTDIFDTYNQIDKWADEYRIMKKLKLLTRGIG